METLLFSLFLFPASFVQGIFFLATVQVQMTLHHIKMLQVPTAAVLGLLLLLWKEKKYQSFPSPKTVASFSLISCVHGMHFSELVC